MLTRRLQLLQPLARKCILRPITLNRFASSDNSDAASAARRRRARFITRETRYEEPVVPPSEVTDPPPESPSPGPLPLSLYEALFRKPTPSPTEDAIEHTTTITNITSWQPSFKNYDEEPPRVNLRADDELSGWLNEALVKALRRTPQEEAYSYPNPPSVLLLSPLPRSLLPSDFFRIAPQGHHVDGWAKGLQKVIQARHPHTHEPREQYFLIFENRTSAQAYLNHIQSLHHQTLEALHPAFHPPSTYKNRGQKPVSRTFDWDQHHDDPLGEEGEAEDSLQDGTVPIFAPSKRDQLLSYALLPPTMPLRATLIRLDSLLAQIHQKTLNHPGLVPYAMQRHLTPNHKNPPQPDDNRVLVKFKGGKITKERLHDAIIQDGVERNLEWELELFDQGEEILSEDMDGTMTTTITTSKKKKVKREWNTIHPLKISEKMVKLPKTEKEREEMELRREQRWEEEEEFEEEQEAEEEQNPGVAAYSRYIVSFRTVTEAKRFARAWHQRNIHDVRTDRVLKVHCTGLW
ncbi:hypothetical protein QBC43DRAFT_314592 [Cladorrhinum sp. PSN259]|nr:hypothetical protein QBC43DRAFT_314592 [Cladorrhinum sp. PSN259]